MPFRIPALILTLAVGVCGCRTRDQILDQQQEGVRSLRATAAALGEAWLSGSIARSYTRTALESTQQLLEQQRAELGASPDLLADPRGADLSQQEEHLSRTLALLWKAVDHGDAVAVRQQLAGLDPPRGHSR